MKIGLFKFKKKDTGHWSGFNYDTRHWAGFNYDTRHWSGFHYSVISVQELKFLLVPRPSRQVFSHFPNLIMMYNDINGMYNDIIRNAFYTDFRRVGHRKKYIWLLLDYSCRY